MKRDFQSTVNKYEKDRKRKTRRITAAGFLAAVIAFGTFYVLINPATTQEGKTYCGFEKHIEHTEACYGKKLVCELSEEDGSHRHTEDCYAIDYDCLQCDLPIHEHTLQCFSDPDADIETSKIWEQAIAGVVLSGNRSADVLTAAQTQLGYSESTANYAVQEDGTTVNGYTYYGERYGDTYGVWDAMFCSFCLESVGVGTDVMPRSVSCPVWAEELDRPEVGLYRDAAGYTPKPGDLVFFDYQEIDSSCPGNRSADHMGFVAELICDETTNEIKQIKTIEGDSGNCVRYNFYDFSDSTILGYGAMPENPDVDDEIEIISEPASNGAVVVIKGKLPENAVASVEAITLSGETLAGYVGAEKAAEIESTVAYEISIFVDGDKWEPDSPLNVEIQNSGFDGNIGEYLTVSHVADGSDEVGNITGVIGDNSSICFSTDGFSLFIPLPGTTQSGPAPLNNSSDGTVSTGYFNHSWAPLLSPIYSVSGNCYTASPAANETTSLRGKIDLSLDSGNYEIGEIEVRLPLHVIPSRVEGEWADTIALGVPEYTEGMTISSAMPFTYTVDEEAGEVVIANSIPLTDQISLNVVYSYNFTPTDVVDGTTGCVTAEYRLKTDDTFLDEKSLDYLIDTVVDTPQVEKAYVSRFKTWQTVWGEAPANASEMCFLVYNISIVCDKVGGTQASTFRVTETPDAAGTVVFWGYNYLTYTTPSTNNFWSWDVTGNDVAELNSRAVFSEVKNHDETHVYTVVIAYPGSMAVNGTHFSNQVTVEQTPADGIDDPITHTASAEYTWKTTTFNYSNGISLYKYGQGSTTKKALETERMNSSSYNKTAVTDTGAATLLKNNIPATLSYRIDTFICSEGHTFKLNTDPREPLLFQWSSETIDDQLYLNDELLLPGDYRFSMMNVSAHDTVWNSDTGNIGYGHNSGSEWVYDNTDIWYKESVDDDWKQMDDACGYNNSRTPLPDNVYQVKVVYTGNSIDVNLYVSVGIEILPSDHVKSLLREDGTDRIMNVASMRFIDLNGQFCNPQDAATTISGACAEQIIAHDQAGGYGLEPGQALYHKAQTDLLETLYFTGTLQKRLVSSRNETQNQRVVINYEVNPTGDVLGYGVGVRDYALAYKLYKDANFRREYAQQLSEKLDNTLKDLTFYDLLPAGMTVDRSSITVTTPSDSTNLIDSLEVIENWRGSGRTMIVAHADASDVCEAYTTGIYVSGVPGNDAKLIISVPVHLKYTAYYSWESIVDYGATLHNVVALMNNAGDNINLESGYMDDPSGLGTASTVMNADEKAAFTDLNGMPDTCKNTLYAHITTNLTVETAAVSGFQKTVKGDEDPQYTDMGSTLTGGGYDYRIRYATKDDQSARDIIFYDVLENDFGENAHWNGTFSGVDVSQLRKKGINPVVYYSTKSGIELQTPYAGDAKLTDTSVWSTIPPADLSTVTAIAVDARKTSADIDFILNPGTSIVVMIQMTAPEDSTGYIYPRVYAYNKAQIQASQKSEEEANWPTMPSMNSSGLTRVFIDQYVDFTIRKVSEEDGGALAGASFRLLDSVSNVIAAGTSGEIGLLTLTGLKAGNSYTLEETEAPDGYIPAGPWTVEVNEAGAITVEDASGHVLAADDGAYNIENPKAGVKIVLKKTDGATQIGFCTVKAVGSPVEGAVFALYETDLSWEDYAYSFTVDKEEALEHMSASPMEGCDHLVSDSDGVFSPEGFILPFGIYCLFEQQAPDGYIGTEDPIILVVYNQYCENNYVDFAAIEVDQICDGVDPDAEIWYSETYSSEYSYDEEQRTITVFVKNEADYELPETGGFGTAIIYLLGTVLVLGAAVPVMIGKRKGA